MGKIEWACGPDDSAIRERFWQKVRITPTCWVWTGANNGTTGHGQMRIHYKLYFAHRLAWEMGNGPIPDGLHVCHVCDNPPCVRFDHLFLGTAKDNMADAITKRRNHRPKLSEEMVAQIRARYQPGLISQQEVADEFGIDRSMVGYICRRKLWKHV